MVLEVKTVWGTYSSTLLCGDRFRGTTRFYLLIIDMTFYDDGPRVEPVVSFIASLCVARKFEAMS